MQNLLDFRNQNFGNEIEMTGISREECAEILSDFFCSKVDVFSYRPEVNKVKVFGSTDFKGRPWVVGYDRTINANPKMNTHRFGTNPSAFQTELITPVLNYSDLFILEKVLPILEQRGAEVNTSCNVHLHIDASIHSPISILYLITKWYINQNIIYNMFDVDSTRAKKSYKPFKFEYINTIINNFDYSLKFGYLGKVKNNGLSIFNLSDDPNTNKLNTIEFRILPGTLNFPKIKAYNDFCLALSASCINETMDIPRHNVNSSLSLFKICETQKEYNRSNTIDLFKSISLDESAIEEILRIKEPRHQKLGTVQEFQEFSNVLL